MKQAQGMTVRSALQAGCVCVDYEDYGHMGSGGGVTIKTVCGFKNNPGAETYINANGIGQAVRSVYRGNCNINF